MLNFEYKGISQGKYVEGEIEALNNSEAAHKLKEQKVIITKLIQSKKKKVVEKKKDKKGFTFGTGVKAKDILVFCKQFATMLRAGLPVLNTLEMLINQTASKGMKTIVESIKKDLESGNALSKCFEKHPKVFDTVVVNLIKAGEASGKLDTFLQKIVTNLGAVVSEQFTLNVITYVGLITSLFAASVALLQNDIKKVIAYSTCSQLGYMFFACGISAYSLAMFHLVTHAFFKALLFLGAGCVIHCLHHEQDCNKMGGLYKKLPVTFAFIIIGSIALMGIPPFAGYFSKDLILEYALSIHSFNGTNIYVLGCLGAFLTSVYSTRLIYLTFLNKTNIKTDIFNKIKEPGFTMLFPLFILSIGAIAGGYLFYDIVENNAFWFNSIFTLTEVNYVEEAHHIEKIYKLFPIFLVVLAVIVVFAAYKYVDNLSYLLNNKIKGLVKFLQKKWYFDEIYGFLFVNKLLQLSTFLWTRVDINLIDLKGPIGVSNNIWKAAAYCRKIQNGKVFSYAIVMFTGIVVFVSLIFFN